MKEVTADRRKALKIILGVAVVGGSTAMAAMGEQCGSGKCGNTMKGEKQSKCGSAMKGMRQARCGNTTKGEKQAKCGNEMKSEKPGKCGSGKCGSSM